MGPEVRKPRRGAARKRWLAHIPTKERRIAWTAAANATFTEEQIENRRRALTAGVQMMERRLKEVPWFAGNSYSIADIVIFANAYALPDGHDYAANDKSRPTFMAWLKKIYARPAIQAAFEMGRTEMRERARRMIKRFDV